MLMIRFQRYTEDLQIAIDNFGRCDGDHQRTDSELLSMQLQAELVEQRVPFDRENIVLQKIDGAKFIVWAQFNHNPISLLYLIEEAYKHGVAGGYTVIDFVGDLPAQKQISEWLRLLRECDSAYVNDVLTGATLIQDCRCRRDDLLYNDGYADGIAAMLASKYEKTTADVRSFLENFIES